MRTKTAAGVAGALAIAVAGVAYATPAIQADGVTFDAKTTTHKTKSPTGLSTSIKGVPTDASGQQVPLRKVILKFPATTRINTKAVPVCKASDDDLVQNGKSACPRKSIVGTGKVLANTGLGEGIDPISEALTAFNARKGIIFFLTPAGPVGQTLVVRGKFSGAGASRVGAAAAGPTLTVDVPLVPIPGGALAKVIQLDVNVKRIGKGKKAFGTTPRTCPKSKKWTLGATLEYDGHAPVNLTATGPCKK